MGDYFGHWVKIGQSAPDKSKLPAIFNVNWFRKSAEGKFLWPGYGDNIRVLKWIFERVEGSAAASETAIGYVPAQGAIDTSGLNGIDKNMTELLAVEADKWNEELELINEHYAKFGDSLPAEMKEQLFRLVERLQGIS
jgi:phosphoenolpyruvate carboxykinase (GTP)